MPTVAASIVSALADHGVTQVWGVVGDALNPVTEAIRTEERIEWVGVRHEEVAAFAVSAQAQLTGTLGVCMGTVGPGSIHLLNGLYDAKKSHAPVLAICGQVPSEELGSDFFQEVDNDRLFADVAVFAKTVTSAAQMPLLLEQAVNAALAAQGVAVLTLPGDLGDQELPKHARPATFAPPGLWAAASESQLAAAASVLSSRQGHPARRPRGQGGPRPGAGARRTAAGADGADPQGEGGPRARQPLPGRPVRPDRQPGGGRGDGRLRRAVPGRHRLPVPRLVPRRRRPSSSSTHARRTSAGVRRSRTRSSATSGRRSAPCCRGSRPDRTAGISTRHVSAYAEWRGRQQALLDPHHDSSLVGRVRAVFDNPDDRIRPEAVAAALDRHAAADAIFTTDTGMSTVWLSRFIEMSQRRRLVGSYNLGSMANAMPQALGAQALDRSRQVISLSGDGGLMMLLGDLRTAVTYGLPVTVVVFDNGRLGMVKLEQEQGGLPEFGTELDNPDLAAVALAMGFQARRVTEPGDLDEAVAWALGTDAPTLLDVVTNPDEVSVPPKPTLAQGWGFAIAKSKEALESR